MTGITRYILRQLGVGMIFVSLALSCVLWLTQSLRFIELIVTKGISAATFLKLTMMLMPTFLVVILPISLFAVALFTYNKLNSDRELVVLRSAGVSNWALAQPTLLLAAMTTAVGLALSLWIIPASVQHFRELQWSIRNDITNVLLQEGAFNKFGDGLTVYVGARSPDGELLGILVHDKRNPDKPMTMMAERGALVFTATGPRVLMVNGNRQSLPRGTGQLSVLHFDSYTVDLATATGKGGDRYRDARERSIAELLTVNESELGRSEYRRAKVELHQRFSSPFYNLGFAVIALACLLGAGFDRRGQTPAILTAVGLMIAAQAMALGVANLATSSLAFIPLLYVAAAIPIAGGLWFIQHPTGRPRRRRIGGFAGLAG
ncbi:LPS export ABC transporter permease LptF [Magnetospirillum moscoviense]|uniref:LPS export ABC transporter permease LptF n=1 Tax=Magnetospirillum moscoviense TaxID=1437059 RepID=A0A178MY93_9PROT|nr:LPS export ABC transporter permease LptF [Magnetospirillum moscoviense]OAN60927.1 LPS export ABC transporter permease LptF [Magnetospirillum moscoviense]